MGGDQSLTALPSGGFMTERSDPIDDGTWRSVAAGSSSGLRAALSSICAASSRHEALSAFDYFFSPCRPLVFFYSPLDDGCGISRRTRAAASFTSAPSSDESPTDVIVVSSPAAADVGALAEELPALSLSRVWSPLCFRTQRGLVAASSCTICSCLIASFETTRL